MSSLPVSETQEAATVASHAILVLAQFQRRFHLNNQSTEDRALAMQTIASREFQRADRAEKENAMLKQEIYELRTRLEQHHQQEKTVVDVTVGIPNPRVIFSAPSISVQLVMRFMSLPEIGRASRVSRTWRSASASPVSWEDRPVSICLELDGWSDIGTIKVVPIGELAVSIADYISEGEGTSYHSFPKTLESWALSPVLRNVTTLRFRLFVRDRQFDPIKTKMKLDLIHSSLPNVGTMHVDVGLATVTEMLMSHPLWLKMRCIHLDLTNYGEIRSREFLLPPDLIQRLAACDQLRTLRLVKTKQSTSFSFRTEDLSALLQGLDLRSFTLDISTVFFADLPVAEMSNLQILRVSLTIAQVERLCEQSTSLADLHTLELTLFQQCDDGLYSRKPPASTAHLKEFQLACLARLPGLLHLSIHDHESINHPLHPLLHAQGQDASAFKQLRSYEYHAGYNRWQLGYTSNSPVPPLHPKPLCFPVLTRLYLEPRTLEPSALLDLVSTLCTQMPRLQELSLLPENKSSVSVAGERTNWCHHPAWKDFKHLDTLCVSREACTSDPVTCRC